MEQKIQLGGGGGEHVGKLGYIEGWVSFNIVACEYVDKDGFITSGKCLIRFYILIGTLALCL